MRMMSQKALQDLRNPKSHRKYGDLPDIVAKQKNRKNQTKNQRNSKFF
jgi:hypothetical protein